MLGTMAEVSNQDNTPLLGKPPAMSIVEVHRLPPVLCWQCRKPIARGCVRGAGGLPAMLQCLRDICRAWNEF